ncbi:MAG: hypothetical protein H0X30_12720 [Anaerolineae bacterium]|nr:hypothetical protein [Anaerolineae bacterium]
MPNDNHDGDETFPGRTYLYIRDNVLDSGGEPSPNALPQWLSPDIVVTPPGGAPGDDPREGLPNDVAITVRNRGGIAAMQVEVDVFVADPTTGWTSTTAFPVGSQPLDVPAYGSAVAHFTWTPIPGPIHRCMLARASLIIPPDTYSNSSIFDVVNDRHIAQHNLNLVLMPADKKSLSFAFMVVNPLGEKGEFILQADEIEPTAKNIDLLRAGVGCKFGQFGETPLPAFGLTLSDPIDPQGKEKPETYGLVREPRGDNMTIANARRATMEIAMQADEVRRGVLTMERNPDTRPGDLHIMEISQIDMRTKRAVGGLWIVLQH